MAIKNQAELERFVSSLEGVLESVEHLIEANIPFAGDRAADCARIDLTNNLNNLANSVSELTLKDVTLQDDWEQHSVNYGYVKDRLVLKSD